MMAYVFTFWTCYVLHKEYGQVASMRLHFLASTERRPDQFTVRLTSLLLLLSLGIDHKFFNLFILHVDTFQLILFLCPVFGSHGSVLILHVHAFQLILFVRRLNFGRLGVHSAQWHRRWSRAG